MKKLTVELLLTGNELLSGDVIDSNSAFIAQQLGLLGLEVTRRVTIKDDLDMLSEEIANQSKRADILIINGGLGPTVDDMTAQALANAAKLPITCHNDAIEHLETWCKKRNYELNDANKKQAMLPQGCRIIANELGSAVGFSLVLNDCLIYTTPGVPRELKTMLRDEIIDDIRQGKHIEHTTDVSRFQVFGLGESTIQEMVNLKFPNWPQDIELGFRAAMPILEIKLTSHQQNAHDNKPAWQKKLTDLLGAHVVGLGKTSMAQSLLEVLSERNKTVTFAESCTGGLMASQLTAMPGSSAVFEAGFVTYSNKMKLMMIDVKEKTLIEHGAVSREVVLEMLSGALRKSDADYGVAVSGIAGPSGGSEEKPIGLVWIAWGEHSSMQTCALYLPLGRTYFQQYVASAGLDLIKRHILAIEEAPVYLESRKAV